MDYNSIITVDAQHIIEILCLAWDDSNEWPLFKFLWPDPQYYTKPGYAEQIRITGLIDGEERLEWGWLTIMLTWIVTFIGNNQYHSIDWKPEKIFIARNIPGTTYAVVGKPLGHLTTTLNDTTLVPLQPATSNSPDRPKPKDTGENIAGVSIS